MGFGAKRGNGLERAIPLTQCTCDAENMIFLFLFHRKSKKQRAFPALKSIRRRVQKKAFIYIHDIC